MNKKFYLLKVDEDVITENLIAIHSHKEAYQIAFYLNQTINAKFKRTPKDLENKAQKGSFTQFEWNDSNLDLECMLFSNKDILNQKLQTSNNLILFELPFRNEVSLITKLNKVDFFIKSTNNQSIEIIERKLKKWSEISFIYRVTTEKIINQLNLIFD